MDQSIDLGEIVERGHVRPGSMGNRVYDGLRQAIIQMTLPPGALLSETDIAKKLNVSRQPVREAFIKLAEAGLVEVRPQRGTFVLLISRREAECARFVREAVEVAFVRQAATLVNIEIVQALRTSIARQELALGAGDDLEFLQEDERFHQLIARGAGCESAWRLMETLRAQMDRVRFLSVADATPIATLIDQHRAIVDGIEAGDAKRAGKAMQVHLSELLKSLPKIAQTHPELFAD